MWAFTFYLLIMQIVSFVLIVIFGVLIHRGYMKRAERMKPKDKLFHMEINLVLVLQVAKFAYLPDF